MYLTRKHLSRRTLLRGAGAAIALPLLDAMVPAQTALAQTAARRKSRLGFVYFPHGAIMDRWTPAMDGPDYQLSPILEPLKAFRERTTVISGLDNRPAHSGAVHAIVPGTWLSCVHPRETQEVHAGITADQIAAAHIGQETPFPSLEFASEPPLGTGAACDRVYGCTYSSTISFRTESTALPMEYNPRKLFQRLFGKGNTLEQRELLARQYKSILDMIREDAAALSARLGPRDRAALGNYLESVREIERRILVLEEHRGGEVEVPEVPAGIPGKFDEQLTLMFDMMALAFQADLTRVVSFMMAAELSGRTYGHLGVPDAFHAVSHHGNDPQKIEKLVRIQTYHTEKFAAFLTKLSEIQDGDGALLDDTLLLYGSNMSNSDRHNQFPLPTALVGGSGGRLRMGQHLRYPDHTPLSNVLLTMLSAGGVDVERLGDSTGTLAEFNS